MTLERLEAGDLVAILTWGGKAIAEGTVEKMTPKQGVLTDSRKFCLENGQFLREHGKVALMTEELWVQLLEREAKKCEHDRRTKAQSSIRALNDQMLDSYYSGITAEDLESIVEVMQSAIASRDLRNVSRSID